MVKMNQPGALRQPASSCIAIGQAIFRIKNICSFCLPPRTLPNEQFCPVWPWSGMLGQGSDPRRSRQLSSSGAFNPAQTINRAICPKGRPIMSDQPVVFVASGDPTFSVPEAGMRRQVLAYNSKLMIVRNYFVKGWSGARHAHPHQQSVYVVKGHILFQADGKQWELKAGDSLVVDGGVEHQASAFEESEVLDIFTPFREDYA
jgi:quercetin dioxygenase-like cupin family protein